MTKFVDPAWSPLLRKIHAEAEKMESLRARADTIASRIDNLVREAVDDGEKYRDIAKAADRSVPWVQTVLRRLGIEGPRVRLNTARMAEAKRLAEKPKSDLDDLMP